MKIRNKIRSIAAILFTVILTLNSVSAEAEGLKYGIINGEIDENDFYDSLNDFTDSAGTQAIVPVDPGPSGNHTYKEVTVTDIHHCKKDSIRWNL